LFTFGTFSSHATAGYEYASYRHYDAAGTLTTKATPKGALKNTTGANPNLFLYKQDAQGNILWQVTSNWGDVAASYSQITPTADGGVLLTAKVRFTVSSAFAADTLLQLIDNNGAKVALPWTGSTQNAYQIVAAKVSSGGQVQWIKHLIRVNDVKSTDAIRATGLEADADGSYYLGGRYSDTITFDKAGGGVQRLAPRNTSSDFLLAKLDPNGNFLWNVETTGAIASQGINSMTLHKNALFIYGNVQAATAGASATLLGHTIAPSALEYNAYSARIDVDGATPTARWVTLLNARKTTNDKGGQIKVTNIDYDGGSVFLSGSFTGFIDKADGTTILTNNTTENASPQLKAFIIRQDSYTGEVLGQVRDDSTGISEAYAVTLRGETVHSYGYTMSGTGVLNPSAWYRTYNIDFTGETHQPLIAGGTAFDGLFLDSTLIALSRGRNATSIPGVTGGIATEAPPAFSAYFLSFGVSELKQKTLFDQLEDAVDSVKTYYNPLNYTPATWTALQAAVDAAETLLSTRVPSEQEASAAIAAIRTAKAEVVVNNPEFQWGAVIRSTNTSSTTPTVITQSMSIGADGNSVFTLNQFITTPNGKDGSAAIYKHYDAEGNLTSRTANGAVESSTTYNSKQNLLVYKLDKQGNVLWQLNSDLGQVDVANSQVAPTADGGLLLAIKVCFSGNMPPTDSTILRLVENDGSTKHPLKWTNPFTFNARHVIFARVDAEGHVLWLKPGITVADTQLPGTTNTTGRALDAIYISGLEQDKDGNFYLSGRYVRDITFTKPGGSTQTFSPRNAAGWNGDSQTSRGDALLVKLDPNGNLLWSLETGGTLYYQSVGAITLANNRLFISGNALATAGQEGIDYFAIQGDTIYPSEKTGAYAARFDVSGSTPVLQWFTPLNARQQTNTKGGYTWVHNLDYDGGELLLTGRFTGFIDNADGTNILANDLTTGSSAASQKGYIMRLNASTGKVLAAAAAPVSGITGYYRAAFRENRISTFGYSLGYTFYHVFNSDLTSFTGQTIFPSGTATANDAAFFDDQMITVHRARQVNPSVYGVPTGNGFATEYASAYSVYYTSHSFAGLQRAAVNYREVLEDSIRAVKVAYTDPTPYTSASWAALEASLEAADNTLAGKAPIAEAASNAAIAAVRSAVNGLIPLDISDLIAQLQEAVDSAKVKYPQEVYTAQTWDSLQAAIANGEELLAVPAEATEGELVAAVNALSTAVTALVTRELDEARNALIALIEAAESYEAELYTAETYAALQTAIAAAQSGINAGNAVTVASLQATGESLQAAIAGLVTKVSVARVALQDTITATQAAYDEATYTAVTYAALQESLAAAQALLDDDGEEHTVAEYEAAGADISAAVSGLVTKISAAWLALQDTIDNTRAAYAQAGYTAASWAALQAALTAAEAVLDNPDASLADLTGAAAALDAAIAALEPITTGVSRVAGSSVIVTTRPATIVVRGAEAGATVTVINAVGSVLYRRAATGDAQEFTVPTGFYIVTVGKKAVKTVVN
jgi:YD repeat-containing protein